MSDSKTDGIYSQLCPPLPEESDEFAGWRRIIAVAISSHVPELEKLLGLQQPNSQFQDDLSRVILVCVLTNKVPPKRHSQNRNDLKKISEDAAAAEEIIRRLISRLGETSGIYPPIKSLYLERLAKHVPEYASLASMARAHADALTDEGGTTGMIAFRTLIEGLAHVFENVMGYDASDAAKDRGAKMRISRPFLRVCTSRFAHSSQACSGHALPGVSACRRHLRVQGRDLAPQNGRETPRKKKTSS